MFYILIAAALAAYIYFFIIKSFAYWKNKGVEQRTVWEEFIEIFKLISAGSPVDMLQYLYDSYKERRYIGTYQFLTPTLVVTDLDLIKQITVKDFDHFLDHNNFITEDMDPLWGKNLVSLKGEKWKDMRATLSPSFTSSKMRSMFGLMSECAHQFINYFEEGNSKTVTVEMKDAFTRYANDVIASTAFGISCDSLKNRENEFYLMGKEATNFRGFWRNLSLATLVFSPKLAKLFGIRIFGNKVASFFKTLVKNNMETREKHGIVRPDMIHLLMEAKKGRLKYEDKKEDNSDAGFAVVEESSIGKEENRRKRELSDDDLTAQALIFFFAGFETVSQLMCFTAYELAINPDIQSRLYDEVDETLKKCEGRLTYEALVKMKYLDMVLSETLRKWPPSIATDRTCVKPYPVIPTKDGERSITLEEGELVWIPIYAIQRDPRYYPEPDRYDPDRFSEENKSNIHPYTYLPFGVGPRSCIGNRFALLEAKTVLFHILAKFEIVPIEKTEIPLKLTKMQFSITATNGFWLGLKPRQAC